MPFSREQVRRELPSVTSSVYLNAGTFGPLPEVAARAMRARVDASFERGRIGTEEYVSFVQLTERARAGFARTLHAAPEEVALQHCTTDGVNVVLSGKQFSPGDEIITTTHEHPGLLDPLEEIAKRFGVTAHLVEPTLEAISARLNPKTKLVAISHVLWTNGDVLPVREICGAAHSCGAEVLVDGAQSVGAIDVDPRALGVDYYTVSGQKWLCGPSGTGALWVHPDRLGNVRTPWPSYFSKARDAKGARERSDAHRLDATTLSTTSLHGLVASLDWHDAHKQSGALEISARLAETLRARLVSEVGATPFQATHPSTIVSFSIPNADPPALTQKLEKERVLVRFIPGFSCVRASIGFWNDASDLDRLLAVIERAVR